MFFGSALNDFGVEPFLRALLAPGAAARARARPGDELVEPTDPHFSGFVFKIQANMNPRHRDRVAFVRVCSGRLEQGHAGRATRGSAPSCGCRASTASSAATARPCPRRIPATSSASSTRGASRSATRSTPAGACEFPPIPQFPPEQFATLRPGEGRHKRFDEAVLQLAEEGLLQVFMPTHGMRHPIVGVIGALQFDVIEARMASEYGIPCTADRMPHVAARWPQCRAGVSLALPTSGVLQAVDRLERPVLIFESDWVLRYTIEKNPAVLFASSPR